MPATSAVTCMATSSSLLGCGPADPPNPCRLPTTAGRGSFPYLARPARPRDTPYACRPMDLYLVRHAIAEDRDARNGGPTTPTGRSRPRGSSGSNGRRKGLATLVPTVDIVVASPFARTWHTAEILTEHAGWPPPVRADELRAERTAEESLAAIEAARGTDDDRRGRPRTEPLGARVARADRHDRPADRVQEGRGACAHLREHGRARTGLPALAAPAEGAALARLIALVASASRRRRSSRTRRCRRRGRDPGSLRPRGGPAACRGRPDRPLPSAPGRCRRPNHARRRRRTRTGRPAVRNSASSSRWYVTKFWNMSCPRRKSWPDSQ